MGETALGKVLEQISLNPTTIHTNTDIVRFKQELEQTRKRGYGLEVQEHSIGLQCVAVPILNHNGECIAAISVSSQVALVDYESLNGHILSKLLDIGQKISAEMGYSGAYVVAV